MRTTTTAVKQELKEHILSHFDQDYGWDNPDRLANLKKQLKSFSYMPTDYAKGKYMVEGGSFLIYYDEQRAYLNSLGINEDNKDYSNQQVCDKYTHLVARTIQELVQ